METGTGPGNLKGVKDFLKSMGPPGRITLKGEPHEPRLSKGDSHKLGRFGFMPFAGRSLGVILFGWCVGWTFGRGSRSEC